MHIACRNGNYTILKSLIDPGRADINAKDGAGDTPLHYACSCDIDNVEFVRELVSVGSDINAQNEAGDTPLHFACAKGCAESCRLLIENGADVTLKNNQGKDPLDIATLYNRDDITKYLTDLINRNVANPSGGVSSAQAQKAQVDTKELDL